MLNHGTFISLLLTCSAVLSPEVHGTFVLLPYVYVGVPSAVLCSGARLLLHSAAATWYGVAYSCAIDAQPRRIPFPAAHMQCGTVLRGPRHFLLTAIDPWRCDAFSVSMLSDSSSLSYN
ncbi:hypothetical protein Y032_0535g3075 [Ancylostoma ceylanicum]|uniref:ZP domain-containing protein n=1 Tax=Ancylostoma ceylanicum TaxID=53326 RepID=A0A016WRS6_9BILA|nr:hypothetical protein Y032_0535g3075 [Ancylostoma ceylanicum]